ncbi:translation elongation factor 2 [Phanerochaete sordida]|uniref:Ribosome assembly protein 1 n=1 Tax=Phanerochaete sordida TaxID=48140 RepID=A0A9P3GSH2_9APHY|nr:translation elongation factor 2 [Phanerochaete sordida]
MESAEAVDVRNVTTIGHVDHGKTTLMDALLAANNIISSRMAGKIRYLDSREDEQERGITMESSAVSLRFKVMERTAEGESSPKTYVVNMIDTPGHVDFSSEVSTASRLCDGALVLVDVVEGVCTQTITVLRQAWQDRLRPILVINKFDRLITELKLAPIEAYHHLSDLIEQVNAVMGSFFAGERMEDDLRWREERERRLAAKKEEHAEQVEAVVNEEEEYQEKDDEDIYFAPERGNVIFASAVDGWGFRIGKFAHLYAVKLGIKEANLRTVLWGDFYLDPKTKRVISHKQLRGRNLKPLFVQFVLDNIYAVYDAVVTNPNPDKVTKIVTALSLKIPPRELKSKETKQLLGLIFSQWLSLSSCVIQSVIDIVPPPSTAQRTRIPKMLYPDLYEPTIEAKNKLEANLYSCDAAPDACVTALVSKMFAVPSEELPEHKKKPATAEELRAKAKAAREAREARRAAEDVPNTEDAEATSLEAALENLRVAEPEDDAKPPSGETLLGFARIYAGTLRRGARIACVLPKYQNHLSPTHPRNVRHIVVADVEALYVMMGRELVSVESVVAGNVFAIKGLEGKVWRNATLCAPSGQGVGGNTDLTSIRECLVNLGGVARMAAPIVRVALEPESPADMPKLISGLKLLAQADPCVETFQQQTGEHVILTAGELHLERCLKDLRERFAKIEIQASKPIVPFRETAVKGIDMAPPKSGGKRGIVHGATAHNLLKFTIRAAPLPKAVFDFLRDNLALLRRLRQDRNAREEQPSRAPSPGRHEGAEDSVGDADTKPDAQANNEGHDDEDDDHDEVDLQGEVLKRPNIRAEEFWPTFAAKCREAGGEWADLPERIWAFGPQRAGTCLLVDSRQGQPTSLRKRLARETDRMNDQDQTDRDFDNHLETGFQLASFQGPLCAEPMEGLVFFVESLEIDRPGIEIEQEHNRMAQVTGSFISSVRDACRNGLLDWSPRLMLAMYECDIQASTDVLGKVYGVVAKRRGRIVAEEMKEGTTFFTVRALLPVVESFGFADEIRKRTSGAASPQLIFSGYEMLDQDPFWVPTTEEELEDLGEKADRSNVAKAYMDAVRERKGLFVDKKIVEFAEKQRTLKR